jgi:hypothetical protein
MEVSLQYHTFRLVGGSHWVQTQNALLLHHAVIHVWKIKVVKSSRVL